jgi:hypothetical protein
MATGMAPIIRPGTGARRPRRPARRRGTPLRAARLRAPDSIRHAISGLEHSPFSYRRAEGANPLLRELVVPFGASGYVALFEIEGPDVVTVLALRHQREHDYY